MSRTPLRRAVSSLAILLALLGFAWQVPLAQTPAAGGVTALTGARVIDGTGRAPLEQATVIIDGGRIAAVGAAAAVTIPAAAARIDMSGKTIVPGLVNAHGHVTKAALETTTMPVRDDLIRRLRTYAAYGVTTVVSLGSTPADELETIKLRDEQAGIALDRARVYTSGPSVRRMKTPEDARKEVDRLADLKVDLIKIHFEAPPLAMSLDTWSAIVDQADKRGLRVAAHIFYLRDAKEAVARGVDIIAHSVRDQDVDRAFIDEMKRRNIGYVPTLTRDLSVFVYESTPAFFQDPFFLKGNALYQEEVTFLGQPTYQQKIRNDKAAQAIKAALAQANKNLKILSDAGVLIGLGTDTGAPNDRGRWQGYFEHVELEMMVKAGLSPMQALVAATGGAARVSRLDQLGTIAPGKAADLLELEANPLEDIRNTRQINSVWIGGRRLAMGGTN